MDAIFSNQIILYIIIAAGIVGIGICLIGVLFALITALGNKHWAWGISILVLGPVTGILYSLTNKEAEYPKSLMIKGLLLLAPGLVYVTYQSTL